MYFPQLILKNNYEQKSQQGRENGYQEISVKEKRGVHSTLL